MEEKDARRIGGDGDWDHQIDRHGGSEVHLEVIRTGGQVVR